MKTLCRGFTLIECMIYCSLLSLLVTMSWNFFFKNYQIMTLEFHESNKAISLHTALDLLSKDLYQASQDEKNWYRSRAGEIIFKKGNEYIGWRTHKNSLYRKVGQYTGKKWHAASRSLIAQGITSCTLLKSGKKVHITLSNLDNKAYEREISLREQVV